MTKNTVSQFAKDLNMPADTLLEQLRSAGVELNSVDDVVTPAAKKKLLEKLQSSQGTGSAAKKITLTRRKTSEIRQADGSRVQVEVRKRRSIPAAAKQAAAQELAAEEQLAQQKAAEEAKAKGITRSMAAVEHAANELGPKLFVFGNAPTSIFKVLDMVEEGTLVPDAVIGVPVGFVGAAESKQKLHESQIPSIVALGSKGGSTIAAAVVNAILYQYKQEMDDYQRFVVPNN